MNIAVFGYTDKRPFLLALLKVLQTTGEVILITENKQFVRYNDNFGEVGSFGNIQIAVSSVEPEEVFHELDLNRINYKHIITDCYDRLPEDTDKVVYVATNYISLEEQELMQTLPSPTPVYFLYQASKRRQMMFPNYKMEKLYKNEKTRMKPVYDEEGKVIGKEPESVEEKRINIVELPKELQISTDNSFLMTMDLIESIERSEYEQLFHPLKSEGLAKVVHNIIKDEIGMTVQQVQQVLEREWDG